MFVHYLKSVLRSFRREPFPTLVNVLTLALGLVCFVTAYAVVDYWQKGERYFANADRIAVITADLAFREGSTSTGTIPWTARHYEKYLRTDFPELEAIARVWPSRDVGVSTGERSIRIFRMIVDPEFLHIFDLPFIAGDPREALRQPNSVVLTQETATRLFGDENPMGRNVVLFGITVDTTVTGVISAIPEPSHMGRSASAGMSFDLLASWNVWDEFRRAMNPDAPVPPPERWMNLCCATFVLLPDDGSLPVEIFNSRLDDFAARHVPPEQLSFANLEIGALPVNGLMVAGLNASLLQGAQGYVSITALLLILGGLILAVACVNYANLATARAAGRAREVGMRKVVGAGSHQVILQYLFESALLTTAALMVAVSCLVLIVPVFRTALGMDLTVSMFAGPGFWIFLAVLMAIVTVIAGAYPALILSRVRPVEALRIGRVRMGPRFVSTLLVGVQFAAASFLLIAVIVMYAQNSELRRTGLGLASDPLFMIDNPSNLTGLEDDTLRTELLRLPQVRGITGVGQRPWALGTPLSIVSRSPDESTVQRTVFRNFVGENFFSVLEMEVLAGRVFDLEHGEDLFPEGDLNPDQTITIVVDHAFSEELGFSSPQAAVDQLVYWPQNVMEARGLAAQPLRVIGVVENKPMHFFGLGATSNLYTFHSDMENKIVLLSADDVAGAVESIEALWKRLAPHVPFGGYFLDDLFDENYENFGRINQVFVGLSVLAFLISTIGLFAMAIQVANRRVHEIGVRKTLGATTRQVVGMLMRDFAKPVLIANLIAWPLAYIAAQAYLGLFIHRIALTPLPFILSLIVTVGIACLAVGGQALRAARVRPAEVLKYE